MSKQAVSLDVIRVDQPCPASWDAMRGDDQVRFCKGCQKYVHNLSAMTRAQAATLLETCGTAGGLCVRFSKATGRVVETLDYQPGPARAGRGWRFWAGLAGCLAAGVAAVNAVVFRSSLPPPLGPTRSMLVMGRIAIPPAPTSGGAVPACPVAPPRETPEAP